MCVRLDHPRGPCERAQVLHQRHVVRSAGTGAGRAGRRQRLDGRRRHRPAGVERCLDRAPDRNRLEQRVRTRGARKLQVRNRPAVQPSGCIRHTFGKLADREIDAALGGGDARELEEAAEADRDLAVERIGDRQTPVEIAMDQRFVLADQRDQPGLTVVRVWRKDRVAEGVKAHVVRRGHLPRRERPVRRPGRRERSTRAQQRKAGAAGRNEQVSP